MQDVHKPVAEPVFTGRFWSERLAKHGHTGWADPVIYAYDQLERLALVKAAVLQHAGGGGLALDFGCGTGDFSKLLLRLGFTVCGYDPFVQVGMSAGKFSHASTYEQIPFAAQTVDLILTVTTLDHILDEGDLRDALAVIRKHVKPAGTVLMVEYALDSVADREKFNLKSDYQVCRTVSDWERVLGASGFRVLGITPWPQPVVSPSAGFFQYNRSILVRIARRCWRWPCLRSLIVRVLEWQAERFVQPRPTIAKPSTSSPLKMIRCCSQ